MKSAGLLVLTLLFVVTVSCASFRDEPGRTGRQALLNRSASAVEKTGREAEISISGELTGVMAGSTVGGYSYDVCRTQVRTNKEYGYAHDRGAAARIESASVAPRFTRPGDRIDLKVTYAVLTHSDEPTTVWEIREIWYGDNLWGGPEAQVERAGGTYESTIPLYLSGHLRPGTYKVRYIVQTPTSRDVREANFTVQQE